MTSILSDKASPVRPRVFGMFALLAVFNALTWLLALAAFASRPLLLGTALLAYAFGLRHAVDADHIAAIDSVTRKLMQERKRPVSVGFFFSLGHSTVVVALSALVAMAGSLMSARIPGLASAGGVIGTSVSALFLIAIAIVNGFVLVQIIQAFRRVRRGEASPDRSLDDFLGRGLMGRFFRPLLRLVKTSRQMYPVGLLFGLGFDTATEVAVLGIAAIEGVRGLPFYFILIFPLLFTAGMSLIDTADGILMLGAYGWAFAKPARKLYYNMTITLVSVLVALFVGGLEALSVIGSRLGPGGWFWERALALSSNFGALGFTIVGIFAAGWGLSALVYKLNRYDAEPEGARVERIA